MKYILLALTVSALMFSCAPVRFSKSDNIKVNTDAPVDGNNASVVCSPVIAPSATTFTYASAANPDILSRCTTANLNYEWTIKRPDSSVVTTSIPTLTGVNPTGVDIRVLGEGTYYVYLTATDPSGVLSPYNSTTPLELVVPGAGTGNSLTCNPKLNNTLTSVSLNSTDNNALVTANCAPLAGAYTWTVTKNGTPITIAGLSGESSTPDIKSYGTGTYLIKLYATATGSAHWESTSPLTVVVNEPVVNPLPSIACNPKINGTEIATTLTNSSANPLISANCNPGDVTYAWRTVRNGQTITVSDLTGANSNPNFFSLGNGTYLIYLTASKSGFSSWSTTTPLTITVDVSGAPNLTINCAPRFNADSTNLTITSATGNPTLTSNCTPNTVTLTWTVYRNGQLVTIANLTGPSSIPDFLAAGLGTYSVYLTASQAGYNTYVSPTPLQLTVSTADVPYRRVELTKDVKVTDNKVDILLVVDDSNSMLPDNQKLAQKLQGFVSDLTASQIDWQMCATVTRAQDIKGNGTLYWGASRNWVNYVGTPKWILNGGAADPNSIFVNTINAIGAGWAGSDDERGIKAAYSHVDYAPYNTCYRTDASMSVIVISDEDERSVGGDSSQVYYQGELQPLEAEDLPQNFVNKVKQTFGQSKRFTVNSIIVKPGDTTCMATQDAGGAKSHYGVQYDKLSKLTNGFSSSICEADFSKNLNYFKDRIVSSLASIPLECTPVGNIDITITPAVGGISSRVENNTLIFTPAVPAGRQIKVGYNCPQN